MAHPKGPYVALAAHPHFVHLLTSALMGRTADCLREHGIEPSADPDDKVRRRENARLHLALHPR